jgi:hypothetical protein
MNIYSLTDVLYQADKYRLDMLSKMDKGSFKEFGGVILYKHTTETCESIPEDCTLYQFIPITNALHNTDEGAVVYHMDLIEYGKLVVSEFNNGWKAHASYHVHPPSLGLCASSVDFDYLFKNYPVNYVAGASHNFIMRYRKLDNGGNTIWEETRLWMW